MNPPSPDDDDLISTATATSARSRSTRRWSTGSPSSSASPTGTSSRRTSGATSSPRRRARRSAGLPDLVARCAERANLLRADPGRTGGGLGGRARRRSCAGADVHLSPRRAADAAAQRGRCPRRANRAGSRPRGRGGKRRVRVARRRCRRPPRRPRRGAHRAGRAPAGVGDQRVSRPTTSGAACWRSPTRSSGCCSATGLGVDETETGAPRHAGARGADVRAAAPVGLATAMFLALPRRARTDARRVGARSSALAPGARATRDDRADRPGSAARRVARDHPPPLLARQRPASRLERGFVLGGYPRRCGSAATGRRRWAGSETTSTLFGVEP